MSDYKFQIQQTVEALDEIEDIIFNRMLNLAMEGELKEIGDTFEIDDVVSFKLEDLQNLEDSNVKLLIDIFNQVVHAKDKFENLYP